MSPKKIAILILALIMATQSLLTTSLYMSVGTAKAQDSDTEDSAAADSFIDDSGNVINLDGATDETEPEEVSNEPDDGYTDTAVEDTVGYLTTHLAWISSIPIQKPALAVGPQDDVNKLAKYQIDMSAAEYLLKLITPTELGGYGVNHIKVNRIESSYTSTGNGKNDRENASSLEEDSSNISAHHYGRAVDISEYGAVTCKLVEKSYLGGNKTHWLAAQPVKVAWQSTVGISNNPTPNAQSLMEAAGLNSAKGMMDYLNGTGEMDAYVDYVKGLNLSQIITYIGANVYLKNYATSSIVADPLADSLIHIIGGAALEKAIPGLPDSLASGKNDEDARVAFAKAKIEEGLNIPGGSLRGYGWDSILNSVGKRNIENALNLPSLYLEEHELTDITGNEITKTALEKFKLDDNSFNVPAGTVDLILANDKEGLKMAGVNILSSALKLTSQQTDSLLGSVKAKTTPTVNLNNAPVDNSIGMDDLSNMFSADTAKQKKAEAALKEQGLKIITEAISSSSPQKFSGVSQAVIDLLTDTTSSPTLGDVKQTVAENKIAYDNGLTDSQKKDIGKSDKVNLILAAAINDGLGLTDDYLITAEDIKNMNSNKNQAVLNKIGGAQIDKAMGWDPGTGGKIISGKVTLNDAFSQIASNAITSMLGLDITGVSLTGDISANFANAIVDSRLGFDNGTFSEQNTNADATSLSDAIGEEHFNSSFNLPSGKSLVELRGDSGFWDDEENIAGWEAVDINNNLPLGTTKKYLLGEMAAGQYRKDVAKYNAINITADKIWNYFGLEDKFKIDSKEALLIAKVIGGGDSVSFDDQQGAIQAIYKALGRSVDQGSGFNIGSMASYFLATTDKDRTNILIENGVRLFAKSLGLKTNGNSDESIAAVTEIIINAFNNTSSPILTASYQKRLTDMVVQAVGIPAEYEVDAAAFARGDFRTGYAAVTFTLYANQINKYLPEESQLTYEELRDTIIYDIHNTTAMSAVLPTISYEVPIGSTVTYLEDGKYGVTPLGANQSRIVSVDEASYQAGAEEYRKDVMEKTQKSVEYKVSDSFLRKADSTIPVGFSRAMLEGSEADRSSALLSWGFNNVDKYLQQVESAYVPGTLEKIFKGQLSSVDTDDLVTSIINRAGVSFGPFTTDFMVNFYSFVKNSTNANVMQSELLKSDKYAGMWSYFDGWLSDNLGIGEIPAGLAQSIFLASKSNWSLDVQLKDSSGNIAVKSLKDYGEDFLVSRITGWADKELGLPVGRIYQMYQAYTSYTKAFAAYRAVSSADKAAKAAAANSATKAGNAMILLAVEIGLEMCDACQAAFKSIDSALAAPAGFTQAALLGALQSALGLGPWGLVAAGVLYLFGTYDTDYLCPKAPYDLYSVTGLDPPEDQITYNDGKDTDYYYVQASSTDEVKYSPKSGTTYFGKWSENPFSWQTGVKWGNGDNNKLWMGWARYFTGQLIQNTLDYGSLNREYLADGQSVTENNPSNLLQQIITYRQANADFFSPQSTAAFGDQEQGDNSIGIFYTQTTTKITDWVHVGFGGTL